MADLITTGFETSILAGHISQSSINMYTRDFAAYLSYAGSKDNAFNTVTLNRWVSHLVNDSDMSPNTINRMVSAVKKIMIVASKQGYISSEIAESFKHVEGVKASSLKGRMRIRNRIKIEPEQMRALIDSIDRSTLVGLRNAALFITLASSGLRVKELSLLKQEQVIKKGDGYFLHMYAEHGKNQEEDREAYISVEAVGAVRKWLEARPIESPYIFTSFQGKSMKPNDKPISSQGVWNAVKEITEAQGLQDIKPHDFRRFVGTQLAKKDIRIAQMALGHKRIETTVKYDLREIEVGTTDNLF